MITYSFYLKSREDAVEIEGDSLEDDGTRVRVIGRGNASIAVFVWAELQGYSSED